MDGTQFVARQNLWFFGRCRDSARGVGGFRGISRIKSFKKTRETVLSVNSVSKEFVSTAIPRDLNLFCLRRQFIPLAQLGHFHP